MAQCMQTIALVCSLPAAYQLQVKRKKIKIVIRIKTVMFISRHKKEIFLEILFHVLLTGNFTIYIQNNMSFSCNDNKKILCENLFCANSI